jgi:glutathionyl-hydroquinone reductase
MKKAYQTKKPTNSPSPARQRGSFRKRTRANGTKVCDLVARQRFRAEANRQCLLVSTIPPWKRAFAG